MEPKLRFPEFNSNWTHDNLENVAEIFDGTHQTPLYTKTGVQFVSVENIEDIYKSEKYISHEEYDKYKNKPQINDILMTRITAGVIGETAMVTKDVPLAYYVSLALIRCEKLFPSYVEKYIHSIQFRKELYKRIIHTAFPKKINLGDIGKCLVGITNEQEQQKIAEFLSTIDTVIEKQKETVSAWEERKKVVMQKLFSQEVRFKADDGSKFPDWKEQSFSDVFENLNNSTFSRDCLNYEAGSVKYIHYGDILIKFGFVIDVQSSNVPYVNEDLNCEKYVPLSDGDIVIADTAEDDTVGKAVEIMNTHCGKTISGLHTIACHPREKFASKYLGYFMNADIYHNQLRPYMQGIKVTSISKTNIALTKILVPCLAEQQKIADCLSSLDEVIGKQKATLAAWEELKKGLLQQMFI